MPSNYIKIVSSQNESYDPDKFDPIDDPFNLGIIRRPEDNTGMLSTHQVQAVMRPQGIQSNEYELPRFKPQTEEEYDPDLFDPIDPLEMVLKKPSQGSYFPF